MSKPVQWKLFIRKRGSATQGVPPGKDDLKWVANTTTLIYGEQEALLVDTFLSDPQTAVLADWIVATSMRLSTIYITHAHPDHFFGLKLLRDRFPSARAVALPQVVESMRRTVAPDSVESWQRRFPGMIPARLVAAEPLDDGTFFLEGNAIVALDIGHTDTDHTTCLHVPSVGLVVAGDAIYNGTHPYLVESNGQGLTDWLAAIDKIESLNRSAAALFVALNAVFGFLYSLGHEPIANAAENGPLAYFYFSIETLATVGYGDMHPKSNYGHLIATIEIFTGMCFLAVMTGLIFARFSRPRARFVFANNPVITRHEGRQTLMVRMANARHNAISRANARLWIMRAERTKEGDQLRRFYELKLDCSEHPMFVLSWMLFHVIDKDSPLHGLTASDLTDGDALLVLNVAGVDDSSAQQLYARHVYSWRDIRWQHRYKDINSVSPHGRFLLDYTKFHDTVSEE